MKARLLCAGVGLLGLVGAGLAGLGLLDAARADGLGARLDGGFAALALLLFGVGNLALGPRFAALLPPGAQVGRGLASGLFFAGQSLHLLLPGPAGELALCAALGRRCAIPLPVSLAAAAHSRMVGLAGNALVALVALPFVPSSGPWAQVLWLAAALITALGLGLGALSASPRHLSRLGAVLAARGWGRPGAGLRHLGEALAAVWAAPASAWGAAMGWTAGLQAAHIGALVCAGLALGLPLSWPSTFLAQGVGNLSMALSPVLPAGLGAYDMVLMQIFTGLDALGLVEGALLLLGVRLIHLGGLACAGLVALLWAPALTEAA